jgi:hypothetical protein
MKKKLQLDDVDVVFESKPLTKEELRLISAYILKDKARYKNETRLPRIVRKKGRVTLK